ncbi:MAG: hypothetical protein P8J33_15320 [Pirellulaceae bacterium]|nr:hypothetical protein [Pirellulaceae bacterium]
MSESQSNQRQTRQKTTQRNYLWSRRWKGLALSLFAIICIIFVLQILQSSLRNSAWTTGYLLMGCLFFLTAYNWRKKLSFLPRIGASRTWMQFHIYVALVSVAIFVCHVGLNIPNGGLEQLLAILYLVVTASGVYGLYATRTVPKKLTAIKSEVLFEQIPARKLQLVLNARELIKDSARSTDVLSKFYLNQLIYFFERPRSLAYLVSPSLRRSRQLVTEIECLDRYLTESQKPAGRKLASLIRSKEDLDYHWALQGRLKIWTFIHIGFTYSLLLVAILHGVLAHSFGGGLR